MKNRTILLLIVIPFFLFTGCDQLSQDKTESMIKKEVPQLTKEAIVNANAQKIILANIRVLDPQGSYPSLSPLGDKILFTKVERKKDAKYGEQFLESIWVMDINGNNKQKMINNGYNGVWSPDGTKVAFCKPVLSGLGVRLDGGREKDFCIYDINSQKIFQLVNYSYDCHLYYIKWTKDSEKILYEYLDLKRVINLDTLKEENLANNLTDYSGRTNYADNYANWKRENILTNELPKINIYDGDMLISNLYKATGRLWVANRDGSYKKILLGENVELRKGSVSLTPDFKKIVYEIKDRGIYSADLSLLEEERKTNYIVGLGMNDYDKKYFGFAKCFKEMAIQASVYSPKINPLNGKTIGPGDRLKGFVHILKVSDDRSIIRVTAEMSPIVPGDVMEGMWGRNERTGSGMNIFGLWAVLESYSNTESEKSKDRRGTIIEQKVPVDIDLKTKDSENTKTSAVKKTNNDLKRSEYDGILDEKDKNVISDFLLKNPSYRIASKKDNLDKYCLEAGKHPYLFKSNLTANDNSDIGACFIDSNVKQGAYIDKKGFRRSRGQFIVVYFTMVQGEYQSFILEKELALEEGYVHADTKSLIIQPKCESGPAIGYAWKNVKGGKKLVRSNID